MIVKERKIAPSSQPLEFTIAKYLETQYKFICRKGTRELYVWDMGVYINCEDEIEDIIINTIENQFKGIPLSDRLLNSIKKILKAHHPQRWKESDGINVKNGYLTLLNGKWEFTSHIIDKDDWLDFEPPIFFKQLPVRYDPEAECLKIDQLITELVGFSEVPEIYKMIAYLLMPTIKFQKAFLFHGPAGSGKTTFFDLLFKFLGSDKVSQVRLQDFSKRFKLYETMDMYANIFDDLDDKAIKQSDIFRLLVTNKTLSCEKKWGRKMITFDNRIKLIHGCNDLPEIPKGTGNAFFRRWKPFECFNDRPEEDYILNLVDSISASEFSGLLNKVLLYWLRLEEEGFEKATTEVVRAKWEIDINPIRLFIEECCELDPKFKTDYDFFRNCLNKFRDEKGAKPISKVKCTICLSDLGVLRSTNRKWYKGIKIIRSDNTNNQLKF